MERFKFTVGVINLYPYTCLADDPAELTEIRGATENVNNATPIVRKSEGSKPLTLTSFCSRASKRKADELISSPSSDTMTQEALSILKNSVSKKSTQIDDTCNSFGKLVENKLREYDKMRDVVQYHINTILYHADMGNMDIEIKTTRPSSIAPFPDYNFRLERLHSTAAVPYHYLNHNSMRTSFQSSPNSSNYSYSPTPSPQNLEILPQTDATRDAFPFAENSQNILTKL